MTAGEVEIPEWCDTTSFADHPSSLDQGTSDRSSIG
jgi:hypothetical protein